jgi:uncharacterized membrane protein YtjA (UPF0391 family)
MWFDMVSDTQSSAEGRNTRWRYHVYNVGMSRHSPALCRNEMILKLAVFFLLLSLIAASFGYGGMASASAGIACLLFFPCHRNLRHSADRRSGDRQGVGDPMAALPCHCLPWNA